MKKLFFALLLFAGCEPASKERLVETVVVKTIMEKKESTQTDTKYKYNWWQGKFVLVPDIHTAYYFVYSDGSYDRVDIGKFSIKSVGDTVRFKTYQSH